MDGVPRPALPVAMLAAGMGPPPWAPNAARADPAAHSWSAADAQLWNAYAAALSSQPHAAPPPPAGGAPGPPRPPPHAAPPLAAAPPSPTRLPFSMFLPQTALPPWFPHGRQAPVAPHPAAARHLSVEELFGLPPPLPGRLHTAPSPSPPVPHLPTPVSDVSGDFHSVPDSDLNSASFAGLLSPPPPIQSHLASPSAPAACGLYPISPPLIEAPPVARPGSDSVLLSWTLPDFVPDYVPASRSNSAPSGALRDPSVIPHAGLPFRVDPVLYRTYPLQRGELSSVSDLAPLIGAQPAYEPHHSIRFDEPHPPHIYPPRRDTPQPFFPADLPHPLAHPLPPSPSPSLPPSPPAKKKRKRRAAPVHDGYTARMLLGASRTLFAVTPALLTEAERVQCVRYLEGGSKRKREE